MELYYYCNTTKHGGWPTFAIAFTGQKLQNDDVLFIHWTDVIPEGRDNKKKVAKLFENVATCPNLVFFSGNASEINCQTIIGLFKIQPNTRFIYPANVQFDVSNSFGDYFTNFLNTQQSHRPCDWFDPQLGELKTAFRLLVQIWLRKMDSGLADKAQAMTDESTFWNPISDGNNLNAKLKEALERDQRLKDLSWSPRIPQDGDADVLLKWVTPVWKSR